MEPALATSIELFVQVYPERSSTPLTTEGSGHLPVILFGNGKLLVSGQPSILILGR